MDKCKHILRNKIKTKIANKLKESSLLLIYLDYDGTLAPFAKNPARAFPLPGIKEELHQLSENDNIFLNIITGRSIEDLKKLLHLKNINYAGIHGLEIEMNNNFKHEGKENKWEEKNSSTINLQNLKKYLKTNYCHQKNFKLEDKNFVLTLHHPETINPDNIIKDIYQQLNNNKFEIMAGRQIIEIRPCGWDKGKAVKLLERRILETYSNQNPGYLNIYIGDDTTDEDAFSVLNNNNDITIYVKNEDNIKTKAKYYLNNPEEVLEFLKLV